MRFKPPCPGQPGLFMWLRMWPTKTVELNLLKSPPKVTASLSSAGLLQLTVHSAALINVRYNLPLMKSTWQTREISGGLCCTPISSSLESCHALSQTQLKCALLTLVQLSNTKTAQMAESRGSDTKSSDETECFAVTQHSHAWLYELIRARIQPQL